MDIDALKKGNERVQRACCKQVFYSPKAVVFKNDELTVFFLKVATKLDAAPQVGVHTLTALRCVVLVLKKN